MTSRFSSHDSYSSRVTARAAYAKALRQPKHGERVGRVGLTDAELAEIISAGTLAEQHDRDQHVVLAEQQKDLTNATERRRRFLELTEAFRNRLPASIRTLAATPETAEQAIWLAALSFDRFRLRTVALSEQPAAADAAQETGKPAGKPAREKVVREDRLSVAQGTLHFTRALLDEKRASIVAELETRGFGRARIEELAAAAEAQVAAIGSPSHMTSPEASRLEAEAVATQKKCWEACRRMLRAAAQGEPELEALWAKC